MRELSIFVDESRSDGLSDRHYLLTVVMHDQSENIANSIAAYEGALRAKGLPDIPFHASPLMNGKDLTGALKIAVDYTLECIRETQKDPEARWYGVSFEAAIPMLVHSLGR